MTHGALKVLTFALVGQAHAQFKPLKQPGSQKVPYGVSSMQRFTPPMHQGFPQRFPTQQERLNSFTVAAVGMDRAPPIIQTPDGPRFDITSKGGAAPAKSEDVAPGKSLFGGDLTECGRTGMQEQCTYTSNSPEICMGIVGRGGREWPDSKSFVWPENQETAWSDAYQPQSRCISIWELGNNDFIYRLTYGDNYLLPKCDASDSLALRSQYTIDMWGACELQTRDYKYVSPRSSQYKADASVVTNKDLFVLDKPSLKEEQPAKMSARCERFRAAISKLCQVCTAQATNDKDKAAITGQCAGFEVPSELLAESKVSDLEPQKEQYFAPALFALACFTLTAFSVKKFHSYQKPGMQEPLM